MIKLFSSLILIFIFHVSCKQHAKSKSEPVPAGYDLTSPEILKMPPVLDEISGIAFNKGMPDTMYAEQDEEGRLFYFPIISLDVRHKKFGRKGDYEDIAICNGSVVMLRSDGVLFAFPLNISDDKDMQGVQETRDILPAGEYEGMYGEEATNQLYILCKKCGGDNEAKSISGYILQMVPGKSIQLKSVFQVNTKDIAAKLNQKKILFRPSALAKSLRDNKWYILSSVNKLLVITDDTWNILEVYPLDPALFNQPEGIAFDKDSNLYISNERGSTKNATVLKFDFKKINK